MTVVEFERWVRWYADPKDNSKDIEAFYNLDTKTIEDVRVIHGVYFPK